MSTKLSTVATVLNAELSGADGEFDAVSMDSRSIQPGQLFFALPGENFDGHDYLTEVIHKGAVGAVVSKPVDIKLPHLLVPDTLQAFGQWATYWRGLHSLPVVAITGSCGKTTTKSLVASILTLCGPTLANEGTFNNNYGVPLTLLQLTAAHRFAVAELGANHPGEIAYLTRLAKPSVAVITNCAPVHIEGFGSMEGVVAAKGEIFQGLSDEGVAVLNADDDAVDHWRQLNTQRRVIEFGIQHQADVTATDIRLNDSQQPTFVLHIPDGHTEVALQLIGAHQVMNALAAAAVAVALEVSLEQIKQGLQATEPVARRMNVTQTAHDVTLIDDSYNANVVSTTAALQVLAKQPGLKIFAFADMLELGALAQDHHRKIGETAAALGIDAIYCYGDLAKHTVAAFGEKGFHFNNQQDLIMALTAAAVPHSAVLVKGSSSMQMSCVVNALRSN